MLFALTVLYFFPLSCSSTPSKSMTQFMVIPCLGSFLRLSKAFEKAVIT